MVKIKAGTFTMGSPADEQGRSDDEWLPHKVTLTKDFHIGQYEITQAQYHAVMNENPSKFINKQNNPVEQIEWYDAARFCNKLSKLDKLSLVYNESNWSTDWFANGYRLPTEAEWEYACRAGTDTRFSFGDAFEMDDKDVYSEIGDQYMWWRGNSKNVESTQKVGSKKPNPWNLYDMHGNVYEYCNDRWLKPCDRGSISDPQGGNPDNNGNIVIRSGSWYKYAIYCRSARRSEYQPNDYNFTIGFRVMRRDP